jgi:hypothetical protein
MPTSNLPDHAIDATAFAETLAVRFESQGGNMRTLFAAFAGLVSARDKQACADCLIALDRAFSGDDAAPKSASPSA